MNMLKQIPLPLRIVATLLISMLLFKVAGKLIGAKLVLLCIVLWILVLSTLFYEYGWLNFVAKVPVLNTFMGFLSQRNSITDAIHLSGTESGPSGELSDEERQTLYLNASQSLAELRGGELISEQVRQKFIDRAQLTTDDPFGTTAPAVVAVFSGPRGVGKTHAALCTAQMYTGTGALETAKIIKIRSTDLRNGNSGGAASLGRSRAIDAIDGTLFFEDADWLLDSDPYGGSVSAGEDIGQAVLEVLYQNPGKIFVVLTMSSDAAERLSGHEQLSRWLGKLNRRDISFQHLDKHDLGQELQSCLLASGWQLENELAETASRRFIAEQADRAGDAFDNLDACRRAAEAFIEIAVREQSPTETQTNLISRDTILLADAEME